MEQIAAPRKRTSRSTFGPVAATLLAAASVFSSGRALASGWGAEYFPNIVLTTQDGKQVRFWDDLMKDRKVLINFIYTECGASCPLETAKLREVQEILGDRMGKDIFFYSLSLDPKHDTPAVLKAYAEKYKAGPGWLFLTGKLEDIELVQKKLGQQADAGQNRLTNHATTIMMGNNTTGQWLRDGAMDDPRYIAVMAGDWLSSWKDHKKGTSYAVPQPVDESMADKGAYLFKTRCSACHTVGKGDKIGPDLLGVTAARDHAWLTRFLTAPDEVLASGDPIATALFEKYKKIQMPNLRLGDKDVVELLRFLEAKGVPSHASERTATLRTDVGTSVRISKGGSPN